MPGTLDEIEDAVAVYEAARTAGATVAEAAEKLRPEIELQGALRWLRRRLQWVKAALTLVLGVAPTMLTQCEQKILPVRRVWITDHVLVTVREIAARNLGSAKAPLGFAPRNRTTRAVQHSVGPDPPP